MRFQGVVVLGGIFCRIWRWPFSTGQRERKDVRVEKGGGGWANGGVDVRVGDVEASQVVGSVAEEVEQSVAGRRYHLRHRLVAPGLRHHQAADENMRGDETRASLK